MTSVYCIMHESSTAPDMVFSTKKAAIEHVKKQGYVHNDKGSDFWYMQDGDQNYDWMCITRHTVIKNKKVKQ